MILPTPNLFYGQYKLLLRPYTKIKIKSNKYYILSYRKLKALKLLPFIFNSRECAEYFLENEFEWLAVNYKIFKGKVLKEYKMERIGDRPTGIANQKPRQMVRKYHFPMERYTLQSRKSYRTIQRRRIRVANGQPRYLGGVGNQKPNKELMYEEDLQREGSGDLGKSKGLQRAHKTPEK